MKLVNLVQGSKEWKLFRHEHYTATNAVVIMGASKYQTRKQLLDEKSSDYVEQVVPKNKQILFDKGHKAEEDARNVLAVEEMDEYLPCVGVAMYYPTTAPDCDPLPLMASFDGRSDNKDHLYEHKLWNETLAENVRNKTLEASHYWQLEHQLIVDEKAEYVLFVVSDGTSDKRVMMKYFAVEGRKEELIAAWSLFQSDLEDHHVEAKQELVIAGKCSLPAITCSVTGSQITTNILGCLNEIRKLAKIEMERPFETDQDFADKDQLNKDVKKAREELKARVADIKSEFVSYSEFEAAALDMDSVLQKMQSHGEKQVKKAKEDKKEALKQAAINQLFEHCEECSKKTGAPFAITQVVNVEPDWLSAMKNKRTIKSIEDALDTELNNWKVHLTTATDLIAPNFKFLQENANEYKFLFSDVFALLNQSEESFKAIVITRMNDHKEKEAEKLAIETARIQKEADDKAVKKLEDEKEAIRQQGRDKVNAENKAIAEHEEAIKINAEFDEYKVKQPLKIHSPTAEDQTNVEKPICSANVSFENGRFLTGGKLPEEQQSPSQLQKNVNAIEVQSTHKPLPAEIIDWSNKYKLSAPAFCELEVLVNKYFS